MKTTFAIAMATLLALSTWTTNASALDFCPDGKGCKSGEACHGGICLPTSMICTSDAGCANYEKCDFSCPHGGGINETTVDTSPPSSGKAEPSEGPDNSEDKGDDSAGFKAEEDGDQSDPPEGGDAKKPGSAAPAQPPQNACPKNKGVCVVVPAKITASAACKSFCAIVSKCGFGSSSAAVSGSGSSTPSKPPKATTPAPAPDGEEGSDDEPSSGGSEGSEGGDAGAPAPPSEDDDSEDQEEPNSDPPEAKDPDDKDNFKKVPEDDVAVEIDPASCELACAIWENKKVAVAETAAVMQCVEQNKSKTCKDLGKACEAEGDAMGKALDANEIWKLALGGGWGYANVIKSSDDTGAPESPNASTGAQSEADGNGAAHMIGSSRGCTAGASPVGSQSSAAFIIFLLAGALMLRRRFA